MCHLRFIADFDFNVKGVSDRNNNTSCTEKYQAHIPCSFAYKVICVNDRFIEPVTLYREKTRFVDSLKQLLGSMIITKKS